MALDCKIVLALLVYCMHGFKDFVGSWLFNVISLLVACTDKCMLNSLCPIRWSGFLLGGKYFVNSLISA